MSTNGAIGEVVYIDFEGQQEIGEATKLHQGNEVINKS
jgi:hypothetical protein